MNRGRVGEERGGKETDGCPLTERFAENSRRERDMEMRSYHEDNTF
jgi:hypothetical protein